MAGNETEQCGKRWQDCGCADQSPPYSSTAAAGAALQPRHSTELGPEAPSPSSAVQSSVSMRPSSVRAPNTSPSAPCSLARRMSAFITSTSRSEYRKSPPRGRIMTNTGTRTHCFTTCSSPAGGTGAAQHPPRQLRPRDGQDGTGRGEGAEPDGRERRQTDREGGQGRARLTHARGGPSFHEARAQLDPPGTCGETRQNRPGRGVAPSRETPGPYLRAPR